MSTWRPIDRFLLVSLCRKPIAYHRMREDFVKSNSWRDLEERGLVCSEQTWEDRVQPRLSCWRCFVTEEGRRLVEHNAWDVEAALRRSWGDDE